MAGVPLWAAPVRVLTLLPLDQLAFAPSPAADIFQCAGKAVPLPIALKLSLAAPALPMATWAREGSQQANKKTKVHR
jgi:hypothetical protein